MDSNIFHWACRGALQCEATRCDVNVNRFAPVTTVEVRYLRTINHSEIGVISAPTERVLERWPHIEFTDVQGFLNGDDRAYSPN
jgi:hypothetical protein